MDPISITSLIIDVSQIITSLINYAKAVQGAKADMRKLSEELFALKGILEHISTGIGDNTPKSKVYPEEETPGPFDRDLMARVLFTANEFLQSLLQELEEPATKFKKLKQKLEWPFSQDQVNAHLVRLERVKSWLILVITADTASVERDLHQEITSLARNLKDDLRLRDQERVQRANEALFKWIAPVSPADSHLRASNGHRIGTGRWFIDSHLKVWLENPLDKRILFLVGITLIVNSIAGTGKTTLFAQTVDELTSMVSRDPNLCFAYFYCTISNTASQAAVNILGSLVAQLSVSNPAILGNIRSLYQKTPETQTHRLPINISALEDAIIKHSSEHSQAVIIVDALNESSETELIESSLLKLARLSPNIRILVTTTSTRASSKEVKFLNIKAQTMRDDIKTFIQYRLEHDKTLRNLTPGLQAEIAETLLKNADGSFRWVQLSLDNFCSKRTARAIQAGLSNLPGTLREIYATTLERIDPEDTPFVREALFWVSFAKEPLNLRSLNEAVVLTETSTALDEDMMLVPQDILLEICQGLIAVDQVGHVNLAHSSVREFLTSEWIHSSRVSHFALDAATADTTIMRKCLTYLCLDNFKAGYSKFIKRQIFQSFLYYAAYFWPIHGSSCEFGESERQLVNRFFATRNLPRRGNYGVWIQALIPGVDTSIIESTEPLYYAASFGMASVVKAILASDPDMDINGRGGRVGATPLFAACWRHNYEVAEILLKAGADPKIADPGTGINVLRLARMPNFLAIREILNRCNVGVKSGDK
ncbi:uncharacterized protein N7482_009585 [Penicillium canariense]|uniref:NACHT domain-containing protein n=1 Tax=Penicillium canariense TaxID=189055 RepID=A0A9W9HPM8_9EURO|nr:uncharacterized protein N7482_009585 [Penicillium canariense]KAJ5153107.1 hypothetical protein N7482_009585 [Penicillium canariense]